MAWRAARFPLPQERSASGRLVVGFAPAGARRSHLAQRWRASLQANFRWLLLEHTLNPVLVGSPEGPRPEAEQASMPQGTGGHGARIWGANWVLGKCMAYQVPGRALGEVGVRHSSAFLGFGLAARRGSQMGLLASASGEQAAQLSWSLSSQRAREKPAPSRRCRGAVLAGPAGSCLDGSKPRAPLSWLQRQRRAGATLVLQLPPSHAFSYHLSPSHLQSCMAPWQEGHGAGVPHCPSAPLHQDRAQHLGAVTQPGWGAGRLGPRKQEEWL